MEVDTPDGDSAEETGGGRASAMSPTEEVIETALLARRVSRVLPPGAPPAPPPSEESALPRSRSASITAGGRVDSPARSVLRSDTGVSEAMADAAAAEAAKAAEAELDRLMKGIDDGAPADDAAAYDDDAPMVRWPTGSPTTTSSNSRIAVGVEVDVEQTPAEAVEADKAAMAEGVQSARASVAQVVADADAALAEAIGQAKAAVAAQQQQQTAKEEEGEESLLSSSPATQASAAAAGTPGSAWLLAASVAQATVVWKKAAGIAGQAAQALVSPVRRPSGSAPSGSPSRRNSGASSTSSSNTAVAAPSSTQAAPSMPPAAAAATTTQPAAAAAEEATTIDSTDVGMDVDALLKRASRHDADEIELQAALEKARSPQSSSTTTAAPAAIESHAPTDLPPPSPRGLSKRASVKDVAAKLEKKKSQPQATLNTDWEPVKLADGRTYYYNKTTRETSWVKPGELEEAERAAAEPSESSEEEEEVMEEEPEPQRSSKRPR